MNIVNLKIGLEILSKYIDVKTEAIPTSTLNSLFVGPTDNDVSDEDKLLLASLGWEQDEETEEWIAQF